jgi:DNA-directed RNA polymerase specialized sigma24 family protein
MTTQEQVAFLLRGRKLPATIDREDIEQEAALAVLKGADWHGVRNAVMALLMRERRRSRRCVDFSDVPPARAGRLRDADGGRVNSIALRSALRALRPADRELVTAVIVEGRSTDEFPNGKIRLRGALWSISQRISTKRNSLH